MTRPRPLRLDHFGSSARGLGAGWVLLVAAVAAAATLGAWQQTLLRELDRLEAQASRDERRGAVRPVATAVDPRRLEEAERRARLIALELRLPWNELFDAVEEVADPAVALLAVEPDVRRSALRVSGEARNKEAMLRYVKRLGAQRPIVRALLESHAERRTGGRATVQFTLIAYWGSHP